MNERGGSRKSEVELRNNTMIVLYQNVIHYYYNHHHYMSLYNGAHRHKHPIADCLAHFTCHSPDARSSVLHCHVVAAGPDVPCDGWRGGGPRGRELLLSSRGVGKVNIEKRACVLERGKAREKQSWWWWYGEEAPWIK